MPSKSEPPTDRPRAGFLVCDECQRAIPYTGMPNMSMDAAPQHKCLKYQVRPFSRWTHEDVTRRSLGQAGDSPLEQETTRE